MNEGNTGGIPVNVKVAIDLQSAAILGAVIFVSMTLALMVFSFFQKD